MEERYIEKKLKVKISFHDSTKVLFKIYNHIDREKGLDKYKLLEELR